MERQGGYYWVKINGEFEIAKWEVGYWWLNGNDDAIKDEHYEFINENRIKYPGELPD